MSIKNLSFIFLGLLLLALLMPLFSNAQEFLNSDDELRFSTTTTRATTASDSRVQAILDGKDLTKPEEIVEKAAIFKLLEERPVEEPGKESPEKRFINDQKKITDDKLIFLKVISNVVKSGMDIVGVSTPDKM